MALPHLEKIKFEKCPECGCSEIGSIRLGNGYGKHTCGEWREFITFRCGAEYEYSPNFSKLITNKPCQKEGILTVTVDVTVRLSLRLRKETDISELDPTEIFEIPGRRTHSLYAWQNNQKPSFQQKGSVVDVQLIRHTKPKKAR